MHVIQVTIEQSEKVQFLNVRRDETLIIMAARILFVRKIKKQHLGVIHIFTHKPLN